MIVTVLNPFKLQNGTWVRQGAKLDLMQMSDKYYRILSVNGIAVHQETKSKFFISQITTEKSNLRQLKYSGHWLMTGTYPIIRKQYNLLLTDPTINNNLLTIERV